MLCELNNITYVSTTIKIYLSISETKNKDEMTRIEGKIKLK